MIQIFNDVQWGFFLGFFIALASRWVFDAISTKQKIMAVHNG